MDPHQEPHQENRWDIDSIAFVFDFFWNTPPKVKYVMSSYIEGVLFRGHLLFLFYYFKLKL